MGGLEQEQRGSHPTHNTLGGGAIGSQPDIVGKQTRAGQLSADQAAQTTTSSASGPSPEITPPVAGINRAGFIDHSDGANIRSGPAETGGALLMSVPLPPATQVFVSGHHPNAVAWWYVTAFVPGGLVRGYVQNFRITTDLPEPAAKLYQIKSGDTVESIVYEGL